MHDSFKQRLIDELGAGLVLFDEPMSMHTTFRVGGPADALVAPQSVEQIKAVLALCRDEGVDCLVVGKGSNLLVADAGIRGVVMRIATNLSGVEARIDGTIVADAGASNARVANAACRSALTGYEFAAGIPGTVGGAAIMNAGAYDGEFKQVARSVICLDDNLEERVVTAEEADWSYRHSMMADAGMIVLSVTLQLAPGDPGQIRARMDELAQRRADKQPIDLPSAGSTFKRPEGHFAGKLIQDAGMQGHSVGGAQVSPKHAGFVVNNGGATAADVLAVIRDVKAGVAAQFGVDLQPEVKLVGFAPEEVAW